MNRKLFKVMMGGVVTSFILSGCSIFDQNSLEEQAQMEEDSMTIKNKQEKEKLLKDLETATLVDVFAYNGEKLKTLVNHDNVDLILGLAYYDAVENMINHTNVRSYVLEDASAYYDLNYKAIMNEFTKVEDATFSMTKLEKIYNSLIEKWNLWDLSYCQEEVQLEIAEKMIRVQNRSDVSFKYLTHEIKYEQCKYDDKISIIPTYYFVMQSYKKENGNWVEAEKIYVLPDVDLVLDAKKEYYKQRENQVEEVYNVYQKKAGSKEERYILLYNYHELDSKTKYENIYFVLQCQVLKDKKWVNQGQIVINQSLFADYEKTGEVSLSLLEENIKDTTYEAMDAKVTVHVADLNKEQDILDQPLNSTLIKTKNKRDYHM